MKRKLKSESDKYELAKYIETLSQLMKKVSEYFREFPSNILHSKIITIENTDTAFIWNQTGKFITFDAIGRFNDPNHTYNEIVFIGTNLIPTEIQNTLAKALVNVEDLITYF